MQLYRCILCACTGDGDGGTGDGLMTRGPELLLVGYFSDPQTLERLEDIDVLKVSSYLEDIEPILRISRICLVSSISSSRVAILKVKDIDVCLLPATPFGSPMHANPWFIG